MINIVSLRPEPVQFRSKFASSAPQKYFISDQYNPDFGKLFKVKADFDEEMDNTEDTSKYLDFWWACLAREVKRPRVLRGS